MSVTLHIPHWLVTVGWVGLGVIIGWFVRGIAERLLFETGVGRIFGW